MSITKQLTIGAVANVGNLLTGMTLCFSGIALPAMMATEEQPTVTYKESSWIASLTPMGMTMGCFLLGSMLEKLGRRGTMMLSTLPALLGWLLIATASRDATWFFVQVYLGRIMTGVGATLMLVTPTVYCSEALDKNIRGIVIMWPGVGTAMGALVIYALGALLTTNWRLIAGVCASTPTFYFLAVWRFLPESPVWLLTRGRSVEAEAALRRVRGVPQGSSLPTELQEELRAFTLQSTGRRLAFRERLAFITRPEAYKPLIILIIFSFFMHFCGGIIVLFYVGSMINDMGLDVDPYTTAVGFGVLRVAVTLVVSYMSKRFGRRFLCNVSGVSMTLNFAALALFLNLMTTGVIAPENAERFRWFPALLLVLVGFTSNLGFNILPYAMRGEMFPTKIRSDAAAYTSFIGMLCNFLSVMLYPHMKEKMGYHNIFVFYTAVSAIGTFVMYVYLPETQGKTLIEIEEYFKSGRKPATCFTRREKKHFTTSDCQIKMRGNAAAETEKLTTA